MDRFLGIKKKIRKKQWKTVKKGSALAYALVIMTAVMIIMVSMLGYISSQLKFGFNRVEKEKSFQIAEAGIYFYRWYIAHNTSGKTPADVNDFWQNGNPLGTGVDGYENDYMGIGKYNIKVTRPNPGSTIVIVKSTGSTYKMPGVERTVQVRFRRPSWSEYAVLANDFMRFGEGTQIYGKVHSNGGIRMDGKSYNLVTSLIPVVDDPDHCEGGTSNQWNGCRNVPVCNSSSNEFGVHTHKNLPPSTTVNDNFRPAEAPPTNPVAARSDVFSAGRRFPVSEVSFNGVLLDMSLMRTEATKPSGTNINSCTATGCYFDSSNPRKIILKSNGKMNVLRVASYNSGSYYNYNDCYSYGSYEISSYYRNNSTTRFCNSDTDSLCITEYDIPQNGLIFVDNNIWVEGTISNKRITIVAGGANSNIYVGEENIRYTNYDGSDMIGMVAKNNISVVRDSQNNLTIDAALLAQSGRVGREYYSSSYDKNTITVNGSIATSKRYGFAYTDGTGYDNRNLNFDNNLLYFPPPYFPTGTEYAIDLWEEL